MRRAASLPRRSGRASASWSSARIRPRVEPRSFPGPAPGCVALENEAPKSVRHGEREGANALLEEIAHDPWPHVDEHSVRHERASGCRRLRANEAPRVFDVVPPRAVHPKPNDGTVAPHTHRVRRLHEGGAVRYLDARIARVAP